MEDDGVRSVTRAAGRKRMSIEELKKQFLVDEDVLRERLEPLVEKALRHGKIDKQGQVLITNQSLSGKEQVMFVLSARAIGAQLDPGISVNVSASELGKFIRLPANQIRARSAQLIKSRLVESPERGVLRAIPHKVEGFLDSLSSPRNKKPDS
jgi:hypothetical protein